MPHQVVMARAEDRERFDRLRETISDQLGREVPIVELFSAMVTLMDSERRTHDFVATFMALIGEAGE